jgi:hypothetical protein
MLVDDLVSAGLVHSRPSKIITLSAGARTGTLGVSPSPAVQDGWRPLR